MGIAKSQPLKTIYFPNIDEHEPLTPLGLATSLTSENTYEATVEGTIPADLRGVLYRNGPGLFDRDGLRKRNILDGDGMI
ncbi:MAG: carotenoid oxygenase family protein, partial [Candidatus Odinarchaeota archaeon]